MILIIKGVNGNADLSGYMERDSFSVEAAIGRRMDVCEFTLFDPNLTLAIPRRAEIIVYDMDPRLLPANWVGFAGMSPVVDPPPANTSGQQANWTPRLFAGYIATASNQPTGPQREIKVTAQDYTLRNSYTIVNKAYGPDAQHLSGWSDKQIVQDVYMRYAPDIDVSNVQQIVATMPIVSFPTHSIAQFFQRMTKATSGYYRIDYYKRLFYGPLGSVRAPFGLSDQPGGPNLLSANQASMETDASGWSGYQATLARSTAQFLYGAASMAVTATAASAFAESFAGGTIRVNPGQVITASVYVLAATVGRNAQAFVRFYDSSNTYGAFNTGGSDPDIGGAVVLDATAAWQRLTVTATAPPGAAYAEMYVAWQGCAVGEVHNFDGAQIELAAQATNWQPGGTYTVGMEQPNYSPDASNLVNRVWLIGGRYTGPSQTYRIVPNPDGTAFTFPLPSQVNNPRSMTVTVDGTDQGAPGILGSDGTLDDRTSFKANVLIGSSPPEVTFKVTPPANAVINISGVFLYPLIKVVSDAASIAAQNGLILEKVVRDKRVTDPALATRICQAHLAQQATARGMGSALIKTRQFNGTLLQPGMSLPITSATLFGGGVLAGGAITLAALVVKMTTRLTDDTVQPYELLVEFSDRPDFGDDDIYDALIGEQERVNAGLDEGSVDTIVSDLQAWAETVGWAAETIAFTSLPTGAQTYDGTARWDFFRWG